MIPITFDTETKSGRSIDDGKQVYLHDKDADLVFLSYKEGRGKTQLWWPGRPVPECFVKTEGHTYYAFNASFDWAVVNVLGIKYGFSNLPLSQIVDVMAICGRYSYPQALDKAAKALRLPIAKDRRGKALMRKICSPPFKYALQEWREFGQYCITDTDVLYAMINSLPAIKLNESEQEVWNQTIKMNMRGLPIDIAAVTRINQVVQHYMKYRTKEVPRATDDKIQTTRQVQKIISYCKSHGVVLDNLQKATVDEALRCDNTPRPVRKILKLRQELSGAAIKKYSRLKNMTYHGRIHDNLRYWGAGPGRWAGLGFQAHNLPRASVPDPEAEIQKFYDTTILKEKPLQSAKALIRPMIRAGKGDELLCADYSSIEHILLIWWAGETRAVEDFRKGIDPYKTSAALRMGKAYENVTKEERNREKPVVLGAGYVMGAEALVDYADGFGIAMSISEAQYAITTWRLHHPMVVDSWKDLKNCTLQAVAKPGKVFTCNGVTFKVLKDHTGVRWLRMTINSGRSIFYHSPKISKGKYGDVISHLGLNSKTKQWQQLWLPPNRIIENIIQGLGRDILSAGILNLEQAGFNPIMTVHDEIICEEAKGAKSLDSMIHLMTLNPLWSGDMPLRADGWVGQRYRK